MKTFADFAGVYELVALEILEHGEAKRPWGEAASGFIIYTHGGRMSVGITTRRPASQDGLFALEAIFYGGTYILEDGVVTHVCEYPADPSFSNIKRRFELTPGGLMLRTMPEEPVQALLTWRKVETLAPPA